jgi:ubiquinone/menaquinone biosynthesis C-methylase UbiE
MKANTMNQMANQTAKPHDWGNISETDKSKYFVDYLDTATAQGEMQRYKRRTYQLLGIAPGSHILDIGCGTGDDAIALASLAGPEGRVVGLDYAQPLIDEARQRAANSSLAVEFTAGDVHALDFPYDSFDGCRADRVFMHLRDREKALSEMIRVTKPGGRIVVREPDWDTLIVDSPDRDLTRSILDRHFDRVILNGWAGRELFRQFRLAGLDSVEIADTSTLVLTDFATANGFYGLEAAAEAMGESAAGWIEGLKRADRDGIFFSAVTGFTAVGVKP